MTERNLLIKFKDGLIKSLPIAKYVVIKSPKPMLNLEQLPSGEYRLICSESLVPDFKEVLSFEIERKD